MSDLVKLMESDQLLQLEKQDKFLAIVNQEPPKEWVKNHPMAKNVKYLPIDKVELMLTKIFQQWRVEILREGQLLNSVYAAVRLHYKHPINGWTSQDGLGAVGVQTERDAKASDMSAILSDGVMKGLPAAESYAVKDAAEKIGNLFGKNLNRKDTLDFSPSYSSSESKSTEVEDAIKKINESKNLEALRQVFASLGTLMANKDVFAAKEAKKKELVYENSKG